MGYYFGIALAVLVPVMHGLGVLSAISAVLTARTPQGSIAWAISLVTFPYVAVPLYWVFGRGKFLGFVEALRDVQNRHRSQFDELLRDLAAERAEAPPERRELFDVLERLSFTPWTRANKLQLLVDGDATFTAIFSAIDAARSYVLVQFFIIHDDELGRQLHDCLQRATARGVRTLVLYDEVGSHALPGRFVRSLERAGVQVKPFNTRQGWRNRFQINFRNHRKIVVCDGEVAFVGGHNVGDEYVGRSPRFGHWRDTHVRLTGPAVTAVQLSFGIDWHWATRRVPGDLVWAPRGVASSDTAAALVFPTSPADADDNCAMMFLAAINAAQRRFWIATPYFVPESSVFDALKLAARRGVDVRVLLPEKPDHFMVYLAGFDFVPEACRAGVKVYRYTRGFLHQKVFLVDDDLAAVGTANLDNRSIRLNFEVTILASGPSFAADVAEMLERDFADARLSTSDEVHARGYLFRVAVRAARLLSPVL